MINEVKEANTGRLKATTFIDDEKGNLLAVMFHAEVDNTSD